MTDFLQKLNVKQQRGSKPRCHWVTHGSRELVASRLTALAAPFGRVTPSDRWLPDGFDDTTEAQLDKSDLLNENIRLQLSLWWLNAASTSATTPSFDLASTCIIDERPGLLLVEAKAHDDELIKEAGGRKLKEDSSAERRASHGPIGTAIASACDGLCAATNEAWRISRDSHYQMSNRFAWAWKLTSLGIPVILAYLGFLGAHEMNDRGVPLVDHDDWKRLVEEHSVLLCPQGTWGRRLMVNGQPFVALIRSMEIPHDRSIAEFLVHG